MITIQEREIEKKRELMIPFTESPLGWWMVDEKGGIVVRFATQSLPPCPLSSSFFFCSFVLSSYLFLFDLIEQ